MTETTEPLVLDLLEWLAMRERTYSETMEAWRTSCPRLPVWEEANDRGLLTRTFIAGRSLIQLSPAGAAMLEQYRVEKNCGARL